MEENKCRDKKKYSCGGGSVVYCFGLIGAFVYFIGSATTFGMGVIGFFKALVWPAFLVHYLLKFLLK